MLFQRQLQKFLCSICPNRVILFRSTTITQYMLICYMTFIEKKVCGGVVVFVLYDDKRNVREKKRLGIKTLDC